MKELSNNEIVIISMWLNNFVLNSQLWHKYMCQIECLRARERDVYIFFDLNLFLSISSSYLWQLALSVCNNFFFQMLFIYGILNEQLTAKNIKHDSNQQKGVKIWILRMNLLCGFLVMPFFVEFKIDPSLLKLDCRTTLTGFFGGNGGGDDASFNCSIELCLLQRPIIMFYSCWILMKTTIFFNS